MESIWKNPAPPFRWPDADRQDIDLSAPAGECYMDEELGIYPDERLFEELEPLDRLDEEDARELEALRHEFYD
jgi:hypothetical protein